MRISYALYVLLGILSNNACEASRGDRLEYFRDCVRKCEAANCTDAAKYEANLPRELRMFGWTCESDCKYNCVHKTETQRRLESRGNFKPIQYFGKWPTTRVIGFDDFAASLGAFANAVPHIYFLSYQ